MNITLDTTILQGYLTIMKNEFKAGDLIYRYGQIGIILYECNDAPYLVWVYWHHMCHVSLTHIDQIKLITREINFVNKENTK